MCTHVMSKAGLTAFLFAILFIASGIAHTTHAQELYKLPNTETFTSPYCDSPLTQKLVALASSCGTKPLTQKEQSIKKAATITRQLSYATDPIRFVPTPTVVEEQKTTPTKSLPTPTTTTATPAPEGQNLNADLIFDITNQHRAAIGKPAFQKDAALCELAKTRSTELHGELFEGKGALHSGLYNRKLPYLVVENAKYGSDEAGTVQWWINSPVHRASLENNYVYSCVACLGTQCSQLFTSYVPRYRGTATSATTPAKS